MRKDFSPSSYVVSFSRMRVISHGLVYDRGTAYDIQVSTESPKLEKGMLLCRQAFQCGSWESIRIRKGRPRMIIRCELKIRSELTHRKQPSSSSLHGAG